MKKRMIILIFLVLILFTGCGKKPYKTMKCFGNTMLDDIQLIANYTIVYQDEYALKMTSEEKMITENKEKLDMYEAQIKSIQGPYDDIKYYNYEIIRDDNSLKHITVIDYEKVSYDDLVFINENNGKVYTNGKVYIDTLEKEYQQMGMICEK